MRHEVSGRLDEYVRGCIIRTMPLFKLLPGRPRSTFFSSSFFLGGILLRCLAELVVKLRAVSVVEASLIENTNAGGRWGSNAGPAALGKTVQRLELKRDGR